MSKTRHWAEREGDLKYINAGTVGANGKIYFAPYLAVQVLCIDPQEETVEMVGPEMGPYKLSLIHI